MAPAFLRFLLVGGTGFIIDAGLTEVLIHIGAPPSLSRIPAIGLAMLFSWVANRRLTYRVEEKANIQEAGRYFAVAAVMALLNYAMYLALVALAWRPLAAIVVATAAQATLSFYAYRKFAFRRS
jgi:putative flippase GtrA